MSRCPHCKKLTHSEHLDVYYDIKDQDKIKEFVKLEEWTPKYIYGPSDQGINNPYEYGKLKISDIVIHFIVKSND